MDLTVLAIFLLAVMAILKTIKIFELNKKIVDLEKENKLLKAKIDDIKTILTIKMYREFILVDSDSEDEIIRIRKGAEDRFLGRESYSEQRINFY